MNVLGWISEKIGFAPMVERVDLSDEIGFPFEIHTSTRYTVIAVKDTELYFLRENGKYDGSGRMQQ